MKVKCIDVASSYGCSILVNSIYEVIGESHCKQDWVLAGERMTWNKRRFKFVFPFTVKCINTTGAALALGNTYSVCGESSDSNNTYWIFAGAIPAVFAASHTNIPGTAWAKDRFEFVFENAQNKASLMEQSIAINDHVCPTCKNKRCSKSELVCWRCGNKL